MLFIKRSLWVLLGGLIMVMPLAAAAKTESIVLGMGCFWGAEKRMSAIPGVLDVESGYAGGDAEKAGYYDVLGLEKELRRGAAKARNHAEVIKVTFDPDKVDLKTVLIEFWENHDPTQGMRQGNDIGTQYRSGIYPINDAQAAAAEASREAYQGELAKRGFGKITTEIQPAGPFYFAEDYHQQYLAKNPNGYCGIGGTGVSCPIGIGVSA